MSPSLSFIDLPIPQYSIGDTISAPEGIFLADGEGNRTSADMDRWLVFQWSWDNFRTVCHEGKSYQVTKIPFLSTLSLRAVPVTTIPLQR